MTSQGRYVQRGPGGGGAEEGAGRDCGQDNGRKVIVRSGSGSDRGQERGMTECYSK